MAEDEVGSVGALTSCRRQVGGLIDEIGGWLVDFVGDNMLAKFSNTLDAVSCARKIPRSGWLL